MKFFRLISRILVGLVFTFSGFVKGIDPLGTAYRIEDYFVAYGTEWAMPLALFLSVALSTLEFVLGVALLFNTKLKQLSWVLFPLMIFFTFTTFYDALFDPVPDCGCFGDAIKLDNWETFYKNIVLIIFVSVIFFGRKKFRSLWSGSAQFTIIALAVVGFAWFAHYNYHHLPLIDFREWKIGNNMIAEDKEPPKVFVTYKNKETGETKEYLSPDYPWNDSVWMAQWEFVDQRTVIPEGSQTAELSIEDIDGNNFTSDFIENPDYQFIVVAYDLESTAHQAFTRINEIYKGAEMDGYLFIGLTSSLSETVEKFKADYQVDFDFYYADPIILKTMVRSNPGLILLKNGLVLDKWHYNDLPEFSDIFAAYIEQ